MLFKILLILALSGAFGSFLGCLVYRLPRGLRLFPGRSYCTHCHTPLDSLSLIPILGFLLRRGRCAQCARPISWRYLAIELSFVSGTLWLWHSLGPTPQFLAMTILLFCLIGVFFTDLETTLIPDTYPIVIGLTGLLYQGLSSGIVGSVLGGVIGLFSFWLIYLVSIWIYKQPGLGFGDVKLMGALGLFFGPKLIVIIAYTSFVLGSVIGVSLIALKLKSRRDAIPFGPFICVSVLISYVYGLDIWQWLFGL